MSTSSNPDLPAHANTEEPWVTFLMPVFNGMRYLPDAVASVLSQQGAPWKFFIVDDCSTDGTWDYVQTLAGPSLCVAQNPCNTGLYGTLNQRVHEITTPWTCIIFQDDRLSKDYLGSMRAVAGKHDGVPMIWAAINTIDAEGNVVHAGIDSGRVEVIDPGPVSWRSVLLRGTIWTISGSLTRTSKLQEYGFRPDLPHLGDYDFLLRSLLHDRFLYYERPLSEFREHAGQASADNLSSCRDLFEHVQVVCEQMTTHSGLLSPGFRLRLMRNLAHGVSTRGLGALRRRRWKQVGVCARLLRFLLPLCLGLRSSAQCDLGQFRSLS